MAGKAKRGDHAGGIGDAFTGDVIRSAVIGRGADERQTECPVHTLLECNHLKRCQTLVVVHGDHHVVFASKGIVKQGIGADRTDGFDPQSAGCLNCWADGGQFFSPNLAAFAGVRVEPADPDPGSRESKIPAGLSR